MRSLCGAGHRSGSSTMAFILPGSKYTTLEQAPTPTDPRVTLRELPERVQVQVSRGRGADPAHASPAGTRCLQVSEFWRSQRWL